ncbi:hypothetical protein CBR_g19949 [Chara braunii]|uniref:Uncharacterized protein n=1 Tax=Chara braunii TaxID=69332 RepID=A0A388KZ29_CHABU|nr:hypothetical protein CBR_g19949 [Chara braunii]|eukprot:GBG75317.1 hypothetical protein CBR_g19949 [Chara braunii]
MRSAPHVRKWRARDAPQKNGLMGLDDTPVVSAHFDFAWVSCVHYNVIRQYVEGLYKEHLMANEEADQLIQSGNILEGLELYARQHDWQKVHNLASLQGPEVAAKYAARHAKHCIQMGEIAEAVGVLLQNGVSTNPAYFDLYKHICHELISGLNDDVQMERAAQVLLTDYLRCLPSEVRTKLVDEAYVEQHTFASFSKKAPDIEAKLGFAHQAPNDGRKRLPQDWKKKGQLMFVDHDGQTTEIDDYSDLGEFTEHDGGSETSDGGVIAPIKEKARATGKKKVGRSTGQGDQGTPAWVKIGLEYEVWRDRVARDQQSGKNGSAGGTSSATSSPMDRTGKTVQESAGGGEEDTDKMSQDADPDAGGQDGSEDEDWGEEEDEVEEEEEEPETLAQWIRTIHKLQWERHIECEIRLAHHKHLCNLKKATAEGDDITIANRFELLKKEQEVNEFYATQYAWKARPDNNDIVVHSLGYAKQFIWPKSYHPQGLKRSEQKRKARQEAAEGSSSSNQESVDSDQGTTEEE